MEPHQITGLALIGAGLADAGVAMWLPNRITDERQRMILRLALLASGAVLVALGGVFLAGVIGT